MPVSAVSTPTPVFPSCQGSGHTEINKDDAELHMEMAEAMNHLDVKDEQWRFHGRASGAHLVRDVNDLKYGRDHFERGMNPFLANLKTTKRDQYWQVPEWEVVIATEGLQPIDSDVWPSSNLAQTLIDAYFDFVNVYYPLLNRIIFQQQYDSGLYHGNHDFARVCLMVFANGSRFVEDHRVYWPVEVATTDEGRERMRTDKDGTLKYSAGWKYLRATFRMGKSWIIGPSLPELQCTVLVCAFLMGSSVPHLTWLASGAGLRSAQELGIHVRSTLHNADPIERALYNRAFWCLYHIDRINCAAIGRSVGLQDGDFDVELPVAIADQYWGNPSQQPEGSIPVISAFIHMLKLDHVIGAALRTVYSIRTDSSNIEARRAVVVELDTGLNSWVDSVPDGLRWDPARQDQTLFEQSAMLYAHYYYCQILVHRPFIPTPRQPETVGFPSLAICSNAARSITNVVDAVLRRGRTLGNLPGRAINVTFLLPTLTAAIVLLVGVYTGKQQPYEREKALSDVRRCISVVREIEQCWRQAGKMTDMLVELSRDVDLPTDSPPPPLQGVKRSNEHLLEPLVEQQWQPPVPSPLFSQPFIDPMNQMPALDMNPFEAFQATYGGVANFDLPGQSDDDVDLWSQLFGGYRYANFLNRLMLVRLYSHGILNHHSQRDLHDFLSLRSHRPSCNGGQTLSLYLLLVS
jgi:hypothetical protein